MNPELTKEKVLSNLQDFGYKAPSTSQVGGAITRQGIISQDGITPITADSLTPETPIVTPNAPTPTASLGVSTQAEQYAKSSKANADAEQQRLDKQQEALQSSEQSIADIITGMGEAGNKKQQAYQDQGLIDIKKSSDSVRTAMESANLATRRRIEELQKNNPEGQSASALSAQIRDIEAKNASYQADQAIVLSALNRDFDTAKSFIDAKVDAETEQMKATLDARTFLYENNKDRFTKAEQRKIEADLRDENRAYQEEKETKKTLEEKKIEAMENAQEQGAPTSIIQAISKSKTVEEVITNAGQYGGDIKRKLDIQETRMRIENTAKQLAGDGNSNDLLAYASDMASTGKLPSPSEVKASGLTVGQVAQMAREIPQQKGFIASAQTGVKDQKIPATEQQDYQKLYNITENIKRLKELDKERVGGLIAGTLGKVFGADKQAEYLAVRKAIVDDISRMQSGAALTEEEVSFYEDYLPGRFSEPFGFGQDSLDKIENFESIMNNRLTERLNSNGLVIYGYSTVDYGGRSYRVGDKITLENGKTGTILPGGYVSTQ